MGQKQDKQLERVKGRLWNTFVTNDSKMVKQ